MANNVEHMVEVGEEAPPFFLADPKGLDSEELKVSHGDPSERERETETVSEPMSFRQIF